MEVADGTGEVRDALMENDHLGISQGDEEGMDLRPELYLGGVGEIVHLLEVCQDGVAGIDLLLGVCLGGEVGTGCLHWCDAEEIDHHLQVYQDDGVETSHLGEETVHLPGVYQGTVAETGRHLEATQEEETGCFLVETALLHVVCRDSVVDLVVPWERSQVEALWD